MVGAQKKSLSLYPLVALASGMSKPILPPRYARRLFCSSFTGFSSVAAAALNEQWDCCCCAALVAATSLNHWRLPVFGLRRALDLAAVWVRAAYQLGYVSPRAPEGCGMAYCASVGLGGLCYAIARRCNYVLGSVELSTRWHVGLHLVGNMGNLLLYDGLGVNWMGWPRARRGHAPLTYQANISLIYQLPHDTHSINLYQACINPVSGIYQ